MNVSIVIIVVRVNEIKCEFRKINQKEIISYALPARISDLLVRILQNFQYFSYIGTHMITDYLGNYRILTS